MGGIKGKRATENFYFVVVIKATPPLQSFHTYSPILHSPLSHSQDFTLFLSIHFKTSSSKFQTLPLMTSIYIKHLH